MKVKLDKVCKRIYAGGDVPKDRYSTIMTSEYTVPIYANAEKDDGLYGYTDTARENELSITVAARGTIGFTAIRREPFLPVVRLITVVPDLSKVSERYLYYALKNCKPASSGTSIPQLTVPDIKKNEIELYSLPVQEKIADKLDVVVRIIALRQQELQRLDDLVKARFVELFGTCAKLKRLEEYASLITKGASPKWQGVDYCEEGVLFVTSENVREGYLDFSKRKYLDDKINEIQPRSMLKRNDILINIVGASIGRAAVYNCDEIANINQAVALVRVDYSRINQTYLMTYLNSAQAIEMYGKIKKGGARDNLSLQNIADLQISVASMELQEQFAAFVKQTDKSKLAIQQSLDKLELLKKALMQKYFG